MIKLALIAFSTFIWLLCPAVADENDDLVKEAVESQQRDLRDAKFRQKAAQESPAAKKAIDDVKALSGDSRIEQAIFDLSADLLPVLSDMAKDDPAKMEEMLKDFKKNPKAFADRFPPAQRKKLQDIANQIEGKDKKPAGRP